MNRRNFLGIIPGAFSAIALGRFASPAGVRPKLTVNPLSLPMAQLKEKQRLYNYYQSQMVELMSLKSRTAFGIAPRLATLPSDTTSGA